jgi:4-hydroxybenzoate polyprenyltransferase
VLRQYLLLVRLPNIFTVPSNILAGYFAVIPVSYANVLQLSLLILSSILLYIAGIVFNDFFDIKTDLIERPNRPLPSGRVPKQNALIIAIVSMISANIFASAASTISFVICAILSTIVIGYDYRLKNTIIGPITMGGARSLNIILGASTTLFAILAYSSNSLVRIIFVSLSLFFYILAISLLSRKEAGDIIEIRHTIVGSFLIIFSLILSIVFAGLLANLLKIDFLVNLILFSAIMVITYKQTNIHRDSSAIQKAIKHLVISIIILDSIFISGTAGLFYGLGSLFLVVPSIFLSRSLYVT